MKEKQNLIDKAISHQLTILKTIDRYQQVAREVLEDAKLSNDDKFRKLLEPIKTLNELVFISRPILFVDESINLTQDIDLTKLQYHSSYIIPSGILDPHAPSIYLTENNPFYTPEENESQENLSKTESKKSKTRTMMFFGGGTSLIDIHSKWLPAITEKTIHSKDLLDQILVTYTIKNAQKPYIPWMESGYQKNIRMNEQEIDFQKENPSAEKLCEIFKKQTKAIATKYFEKKRNDVGRWANKEAIMQDALSYLRFVITGFNPHNILEKLLQDKDDSLLIPFWVKKFYTEYFTENVPSKLKQIQDKVKSSSQNKKIFIEMLLYILFNPNALSMAGSQWDKSKKTIHRFDSYSYQSENLGPYTNFTQWLLGTPGQPQLGKIYQLLDNENASFS